MKAWLLLALVLPLEAFAAATWLTDSSTAYHEARRDNKVILFNFTGSDWCGWCVKLQKEVFSQSDFATFARDNLVLVEVDFPRNKPQAAAQRKANDSLAAAYRIEGYPTIILADASGKQIGRTGYQPGGAAMFVWELERIMGDKVRVKLPKPSQAAAPKAPEPAAAPSTGPSPTFGGALAAPPATFDGLVLKGITGSEKRRLAIINNQTFAQGEGAMLKVNGREVNVRCEQLTATAVTLAVMETGQRIELTLDGQKAAQVNAVPVLRKK